MKVLLVDGNNLLIRALHATEHSNMSADGVNTAPLVVFVNTLSKHLKEEAPDVVAVCWDGEGGSTYRKALHPGYKASRAPSPGESWDEFKRSSWALTKEFLAVAGIHQVQRPGVEADDLIAGYWSRHRWSDDVVILSADKDFLQLLTQGTQQVRLSAGAAPTDRWDEARVQEVYGCPAMYLGAVMALTGDAGDDVPGVHGIGPKKAVKALEAAGWDPMQVTDPRVVEAREQVRLAFQLVDLRVPLPGLVLPSLPLFAPTQPGSAAYEDLIGFLDRYLLNNIKSHLLTGTLWSSRL